MHSEFHLDRMRSILAALERVEDNGISEYLEEFIDGLIEAYLLGYEMGSVTRMFYFLPEQSSALILGMLDEAMTEILFPVLGPVAPKTTSGAGG